VWEGGSVFGVLERMPTPKAEEVTKMEKMTISSIIVHSQIADIAYIDNTKGQQTMGRPPAWRLDGEPPQLTVKKSML
jgi:hypothetical protein